MTNLSDEDLRNVTGGANETGDLTKDGEEYKVYIQFPWPFSSLSKYYGCSEIEQLATEYIGYKATIQAKLNTTIINAVKDVYEKNSKSIPSIVSEFFDK